MADNITNSSGPVSIPASFMSPSSVKMISFVCYCIIVPIMYIVGFTGNFICLAAFLKGFKTQKAFIFQIIILIGDTAVLFTMMGYYVVYVFLPVRFALPTNVEYRRNPVLMFYGAHFAIQIPHTIAFGSLWFFVGMSIDRYQALSDAHKYQSVNPVRRAFKMAAVCYPMGVLFMFYDYFRLKVEYSEEEGAYKILTDLNYTKSVAGSVGSICNSAAFIVAPFIVIVLAFMVVRKYRSIMKETKAKEAEAKKKNPGKHATVPKSVDENVFTVLLLSQSVLVLIGASLVSVIKGMLFFASPLFLWTVIRPLMPVFDVLGLQTFAYNFISYLVFSAKFRQSVVEMLGEWLRSKKSLVISIQGTTKASKPARSTRSTRATAARF